MTNLLTVFETGYCNKHVQHKIRDRLDFGKYIPGTFTRERYVVKEITKVNS